MAITNTIVFTCPVLWVSKWSVGGSNELRGLKGGQYTWAGATNCYGQYIRRGLAYDAATGTRWRYVEEDHVIKFFWEPQSILDNLYDAAFNGYYVVLHAAGGTPIITGTGLQSWCRMADKNPIQVSNIFPDENVNHDLVKDTAQDLYSGQITVSVVRYVGFM